MKTIVLVLFLMFPSLVAAKPIGVLDDKRGTKITIYTDACTLVDQVVNLPGRATWEENGKTIEGCYSIGHPNLGYLMLAYFSDKTVVIIPLGAFVLVTET